MARLSEDRWSVIHPMFAEGVGWMSFFTSTVAPLEACLPRDLRQPEVGVIRRSLLWWRARTAMAQTTTSVAALAGICRLKSVLE